jgi:ACS family hexuronate transporter-like MFS transporter
MKTLRWWILALLFLASVINFIDRQTLSILARTIQDEMHISDLGYSTIVQGFLLAYTISFLLVGAVTDRIGIRTGMTLFIAWWSLSNLLTGVARSLGSLAACRFALGAGEAGLYTVAPKVVAEWFPPRERGLAVGVYTAGATVGATLPPPLIAWLALRFGWRSAFMVTGAIGLFWIIPWLLLYRPATSAEQIRPEPEENARTWSYREIFRSPEVLCLLAARVITDPVWHFILFWFPKYLTDVRHLTLGEIGRSAWLVYLAADVGSIASGFLAGHLIRRGMNTVEARKRLMTAAAVLIPASAVVPFVGADMAVVALVSIMAFAHLTWMVTLTTLAVDIFPAEKVGTIFGVIAAGSGLGGMLATNVVGRLVTYVSYTPVFLLMSVLHPLALGLIWHVARVRRRAVPVLTR